MAQIDAKHWNARYQLEPGKVNKSPAELLLESLSILPTSGWALDIAMGAGRNVKY